MSRTIIWPGSRERGNARPELLVFQVAKRLLDFGINGRFTGLTHSNSEPRKGE